MLFPIQNLLLNTDSPELETLIGLAKTKLQTNICIFMFFFFLFMKRKMMLLTFR